MRKILIFAFIVAAAAGAAAQTPDEMLAKVDAQRNIPDMSFVMQMTSFDGDTQKDSNTLWGFVKTGAGQNKSLIAFAEPASVKGRKMLMDGSVVYLLFPKTKNPIRLSPLQILMGEASNGDVARTGFSQDYDVATLKEAERDGVASYQFTLTVKEARKDSSYKKVVLWVEKASLRLQYAEFFASGDKLLKKTFYKEYGQAEGKDVPMVLDIYDAENAQKHTVMTFKKIGRKPVPDTVFRRDYLETWTPEQPK
jgi:outer membrane lipoprotein-sorting protein